MITIFCLNSDKNENFEYDRETFKPKLKREKQNSK